MRTLAGRRLVAAPALGLVLGAAVAVAAEAPKSAVPAFAVVSRFAAGGEGGWDYLVADGTANRLYVTRGTHVMVLDLATGKPAGEIPDTAGVHGVALAPELKRGYTSNGRAGTVSVFDLGSLRTLKEIRVTGENPDAILFEPVTKRVFTFNGRSANATAIDAVSGEVVGTIPVGGKPEYAASDPSGRIYVNIEDTAEVVVIDAKRLVVEHRWPVAGCKSPTGLALDAKKGRLFVGCSNRVAAVVGSADGRLLATVPTGAWTDGVAFDPGTGLAFVSNGEGTLTVVGETSPGVFAAVQSVETQSGARTVALDPKTHRLYLPTARIGPPSSPTPENPRPRPRIVPGSFEILVVGPR